MLSITKSSNSTIFQDPSKGFYLIVNKPIQFEISGGSLFIIVNNKKREFPLSDITLASGTVLATSSIPTIISELNSVFPLASSGGSGTADASSLTTGTLADERTSANVPKINALNIFTNPLGEKHEGLGLEQGIHIKRDNIGSFQEYLIAIGVAGVDDTQFIIKDVTTGVYRIVCYVNGDYDFGSIIKFKSDGSAIFSAITATNKILIKTDDTAAFASLANGQSAIYEVAGVVSMYTKSSTGATTKLTYPTYP
jgi:hypothetical protein